MSHHFLLAPAAYVSGPKAAANPLAFIQQSHYTAGGKEFWAAVVVAGILLVLIFAGRAIVRSF